MTATQAPTPGPLTAPAEPYRLVVGDWREEPRTIHGPDGYLVGGLEPDDARRLCAELNRLAPTAPVEASGSDRGRAGAVMDALWPLLGGNHTSAELWHEINDAVSQALRPQPSGETREAAIEELIAGYAVMHEAICFMAGTSGADGRWYYEKASAAFEKVKPLHVFTEALSARPLAREQSTQEDRDWAMAEAMKIKDTPMPSFSTTPARAEAQDEGAATDALVDRFAVALKAKLRAAGEKYGFDDAWRADDWRDKLIEDLWRHVQKGDPRDVAAYCAFAWHHQWSLSNGVFPRAGKNLITPQDEGAAGEPVAKVVRKGFSTGSISWTKFGQDADLSDETPLYAHPSPTPAADADRVRIAVQNGVARSMASDDQWKELSPPARAVLMLNVCRHVTEALAALKSTAAKEGGEV